MTFPEALRGSDRIGGAFSAGLPRLEQRRFFQVVARPPRPRLRRIGSTFITI
jgi:hypothetical protein